MYNVFEYLKKNYMFITIIVLLIIVIAVLLFKTLDNNVESVSTNNNNDIIAYENNTKEDNKKLVTVDIKGSVKKQGIYKIEEGSNINDVIKKAGGLLKNATTMDINLSKQVYNEMVIYISSKKEFNNRNISNENNKSCEIASKDTFVNDYNNTTVNKNINKTSNDENNNANQIDNDTNKIININTATKEQLQQIPGIGESKAEKILLYRNENGLFNKKEDIKNVSGIGDSIYEKIKDYITI